MRVIIVGASKVGFALARHITEEGYDLVVIDKSPEKSTPLPMHSTATAMSATGAVRSC